MKKTNHVRVELGARSYDIVVGSGLLAQAADHIVPAMAGTRAIIVSDSHVAPLYAKRVSDSLTGRGIKVDMLSVPAGESSKGFTTFEWLMEALIALKPDRKTTLLALGGGVENGY
jgi:3-dehydroquinate synthase